MEAITCSTCWAGTQKASRALRGEGEGGAEGVRALSSTSSFSPLLGVQKQFTAPCAEIRLLTHQPPLGAPKLTIHHTVRWNSRLV